MFIGIAQSKIFRTNWPVLYNPENTTYSPAKLGSWTFYSFFSVLDVFCKTWKIHCQMWRKLTAKYRENLEHLAVIHFITAATVIGQSYILHLLYRLNTIQWIVCSQIAQWLRKSRLSAGNLSLTNRKKNYGEFFGGEEKKISINWYVCSLSVVLNHKMHLINHLRRWI